MTFLIVAVLASRTVHDFRSPVYFDLVPYASDGLLLSLECRVVIAHNLQRRYAVGVMHQRVNLSGGSVIESLDWHAEDRRHNMASQSLVVSLPRFASHGGIPVTSRPAIHEVFAFCSLRLEALGEEGCRRLPPPSRPDRGRL